MVRQVAVEAGLRNPMLADGREHSGYVTGPAPV